MANSTLSILGAGTLDTLFPQLASELVNETPNVGSPAAAQTYEGSIDITTAITSLSAKTDVAAVADFRLIPHLLEPKFAGYEVVFATTPEVLAYNPSLAAFDGINESNWAQKLVHDVTTAGNKPMAVWNASTDPNGYNEIFSLELQGLLYNGSAAKFYSTFYGGAAGTPAVPNSATTLNEHESQAATLLRTGVVSALITYRSYAVVNHLSYVSFNPIVGLVANNSTALSDYAKLSTTIVGSNGAFSTVVPAPVLFAVTVPSNAPNPALGAAFVHLLLSPQGSAILSSGGAFTPIFPGWADKPGAVPSVLAPDVIALPAWASAIPHMSGGGTGGPPSSPRRRGRSGPWWIVLQVVLSGSLLLLFVVPIVALFTYAPISDIVSAAHSSGVRAALWLTFFSSGVAVLAAIVFGIPTGYLLARHPFPGRSIVESLVALPVVVPHLLVGLGLFLLVIPGTPLYRFTQEIGLPVYDTIWGVVLVMVFVSAPYTVLASELSFRAVDTRVVEAARSLGAGSATAFLTVTFPLALRGIVAGLLLSWARAVSEIGGLLVLAYAVYPAGPYNGPVTSTISVYIYNLFQTGDLADAAAVSSLFLLIAFALFVLVRVGERSGWVPWRRGDLSP